MEKKPKNLWKDVDWEKYQNYVTIPSFDSTSESEEKIVYMEDLEKRKQVYGICGECNEPGTGWKWCQLCNAKRSKDNFKNWTSGNKEIDKFIQLAQLSANAHFEVLEWMPYERFHDIKYLAKGGFGEVYKAKWKDGWIREWNDRKNDWVRNRPNQLIALKSLFNSKDIKLGFINEITCHRKLDSAYIIKLYGITQDPKSKNYMMVLEYAENGSLRNYLNNKSRKELTWKNKISLLYNIALGLGLIHKKFIHRDLHSGNILIHDDREDVTCITDMGLCKPANHTDTEKNEIFGVIQYMAPELLRGENYTKACDIYSFGIIMYEVISELPPYHDHNINSILNLGLEICRGERKLKFDITVPQLILDLYNRCIDLEPSNRPSAEELKLVLHEMIGKSENIANNQSDLIKQIRKADKKNRKNKTNKTNIPSNSSNGGKNSIRSTPKPSTFNYSSRIYTSTISYNDNLESCQI